MRWRLPLYIAAGAIVLYIFAQCQQRRGMENGAIIARAEQALADSLAFRATRDSLQRQVTPRIVTVRIRDTVVVRLAGELKADTSARDSVRTLLFLRDTLTAQRDSLVSAMRLLTARAELAESRVTLLEANLRATLTVADCHLLGAHWLPRCPSRTAMFVIGAGSGALVVLVTKH